MGTKNNPGAYDCYANALPDEPMFILLGRDPSAPTLVAEWANEREEAIVLGHRPQSDMAMVEEARECARNMLRWRAENDGKWRQPAAQGTAFDDRVNTVAKALDRWLPNADRAFVVSQNVAANILLAADHGGRPTMASLDVLAERQRQIEAEGWTPEHDDDHDAGEMALAAACYAIPHGWRGISAGGNETIFTRLWQWSSAWWKPKDRRRDLVRAGALILAEIERLDREASDQRAQERMQGRS